MGHPFGSDIEQRRSILTFLGEQTLPRIVRLTTPLFAPASEGSPILVASGVILGIGGTRFLLTASHVVSEWPGFALVAGDVLTTVSGQRVTLCSTGTEPGTQLDKADVSIVRLAPELANQVADAGVLRLADLDLAPPVVGRGPFLLSGYPERRNRAGLSGETFAAQAYSLLMHDGDKALYDAVGVDPDVSVVLPFEPRDVWTSEVQVTAPNLQGISGGGLWRVPINDEAVRNTRLAAIAVEQHPKGRSRHVLATRIRPILSAIHEHHPDLRALLEQEYRDVES